MAGNTFERIEKKFLLTKEQYTEFRKRIEPYMAEDEFGLHTICNIYYDTESYDLIRTSIEGPAYKEKLRLRSYGVPGMENKVFLEIKKKYDKVVYKRRIDLTLREAIDYLEKGIRPKNNSQIFREIDYFISFYHPTAKLYLAYDRVAMYGRQDANVRITFDKNIRSRNRELDLSKGDMGEPLLDGEFYLMEVKIPGAYPMWLVKIMSQMNINSVSFSKYGSVYKKSIAGKLQQEVTSRLQQQNIKKQRYVAAVSNMQDISFNQVSC